MSATSTVSTLSVGGLDVTLVRKRIRNVHLAVHAPDGRVVVSAPTRISERFVRNFVADSIAWILRHQERIREEERQAALEPRVPQPQLMTGERWWHEGRAHLLKVVETQGRSTARLVATEGARARSEHATADHVQDHVQESMDVRADDRRDVRADDLMDVDAVIELRVAPGADLAQRIAVMDRFQRRALRAAAVPLLDRWGAELEVATTFLGLRRMRSQWGSCVPELGRIWLNVELIARAPASLEYVVVHELTHLLEPSHGPRFKAIMDRHLPDWRARRAVLDAPWPPRLPTVAAEAVTLDG
jgi:predicted metal-dependent hydrolase